MFLFLIICGVFFPWIKVLSERDVDPVRTTSNDICEIFTVSYLFYLILMWFQYFTAVLKVDPENYASDVMDL